MADGLTEAAKAEIAAAIQIVRADRFEAHARSVLAKHSTPADKPKDELIDDKAPEKEVTPPPPAKETAKDVPPVTDENPKRHSAYWGEILD